MKGYEVPDIIWPSSNEYGIPDLLPQTKEGLFLPFIRWGEIGRAKNVQGTYHFFTDDYKFDHLWVNPTPVLNCGVDAVVEVNFSNGDESPMTVNLWDIYRKRWLSCFWQKYGGLQIWVDLNVPIRYRKDALWGVPRDWRHYCTRGLSTRWEEVLAEYNLAVSHSGKDIEFIVYGGGQLIENLCMDQGFVYIRENMHEKDGRMKKRKGFQLRTMDLLYQTSKYGDGVWQKD